MWQPHFNDNNCWYIISLWIVLSCYATKDPLSPVKYAYSTLCNWLELSETKGSAGNQDICTRDINSWLVTPEQNFKISSWRTKVCTCNFIFINNANIPKPKHNKRQRKYASRTLLEQSTQIPTVQKSSIDLTILGSISTVENYLL